MKNIPLLPDQKILNALNDFKSLCFAILNQQDRVTKNLPTQLDQLERSYLGLKHLLTTSKLEIFSMEFYADIDAIIQRISPLRLKHADILNLPGFKIILNAFNELAIEQVYKHPLLAPKLEEEIIPYPPIVWPHAGMSEQEIFDNLDQLRDFLHKTMNLASTASQRSSQIDEKIYIEWEKRNPKNLEKDFDFIDQVTKDSVVMVVIGAAAALLADRAARASADFDQMLKEAKNYLQRDNP